MTVYARAQEPSDLGRGGNAEPRRSSVRSWARNCERSERLLQARQISRPRFDGVRAAGQDNAGSPGSGGASPYLAPGSSRSRLHLSQMDRSSSRSRGRAIRLYARSGNLSNRDLMGLTPQGRTTREAAVRTEPHPTSAELRPCPMTFLGSP